MSAGQKKAMDEHCTTDWALRIGREWAAMESAGKDKLKAAGHDVYPITKEQLDAWRKSAEPLHAEWEAAAKKAGHDPKAVFNELKAEVAKRNVAY